MPFTQDNKIKIHDITEKRGLDFYRFSVTIHKGKVYLHIDETKFGENYGNSLGVSTSPKRLQQLANDILTYLGKEKTLAEWKPTMQEFEAKIKEVMGEHGIEFWIIDWARIVKQFKEIKQDEYAQLLRVYEWLKGNEKWLYEK